MPMWGQDDWVKGFQSKNGANALIGLGTGLLSGNTFAKGLAAGGQGFMQGAELDQQYQDSAAKKAKEAAGLNSTLEYMRSKGYDDLVSGVEGGVLDMGTAWTEALKRSAPKSPADAPSNVQEWEYYNQLSPDQQSQYLNMKRSNAPLNIGTGFVTQDQANPGTVLGAPIAINNEQKAFDTATGTGLGTANAANMVTYESVSSKLPGLKKTIDDLTSLSDTATYTQLGQGADAVRRELGLPVGQGAIDRTAYISIVDNQVLPLLRDTFGAAFTEREGQSLKDTLGDPNKSPAEKKVILNAFIAQKERDVQAMQSQIKTPGASGTPSGNDPLGIR